MIINSSSNFMAYQSINLINLMIQSKNKGHATKWLHNGCLGPSDIKPCNHYTYTEESYKESGIWLQVTLLSFILAAIAKNKKKIIKFKVMKVTYCGTSYSNCFSLDWYMFININLSFTMKGENILCMNNCEHWN